MPTKARSYPSSDVKVLWGLSAGYCAFPDCGKRCICEATDHDSAVPVGKISHIKAHSDIGPRADPNLSPEDRDCYQNWILLCGHHHDVVDCQPNTYTSDDLLFWKTELEDWVAKELTSTMPSIGFIELEMVTSAILSSPVEPTQDLILIPPLDKIRRNGLSEKIAQRLILGLVKSKEVQDFIEKMTNIIPAYPEKLKQGFISTYMRLKNDEHLSGDALFLALQDFASGESDDFGRQAAGLAVLTYLFEKCEVFEK